MTLQPRFPLRALTVVSALALLATVGTAGAQVVKHQHPVGWDRIARPVLPGPVRAADGSVYVPQGLKDFPTIEFDSGVVDDEALILGRDRASLPTDRSALPDRIANVSANVRANDTSGDPAGITNSETTIAALGMNMVTGWNDGKNFGVPPGNTGYASSNNGGLTWTDGGVLPIPPGSAARHEGDPVLTNDNAGNFYFADLYTPDNGTTSAVAVCHGTFSGGVIVWNLPVMPASTTTDFLDKPWIGADKVGGNVYMTWTHFLAAGGNFIEFSRSTTNGASWSAPVALTSNALESCQGSRVVVGPSGEVQVIYFVYDNATGNNYMRTRRSTNFGLTFGPEVTLPTGPSGIISNYGSGPAGYNRARGIGFPSLAIDASGGANNGHVYATWEETVNFYFDPLGAGGIISEIESNDTPATANTVVIGQQINGTMSSTADQDWFKFTATAGQTVIIYLTPGTGDGFLRVFAGGGAVANRTQLSYIGFGTGLCVYTCPYSGTFYFRVLANSATVGTYTVYTGFDSPDPGDEVGRDTRDVIFQSSPDGVTWDARRVINDDPARFDDTFPEVAVDQAGQVFVDWYDQRGDPLGINTDIYYSRSSNGGLTWVNSIKVNDGPPVNWSNVSSNLAPNMGDYSNLVADGCNVYANFADGRQGTPDSWVATINDCATPTIVSLVQSDATPDHVDLGWYSAGGASLAATVFRRGETTDWAVIGSIHADGTGMLSFRDAAVQAGARYEYRIGVQNPGGLQFYGDTWVSVPVSDQLAIQRVSNPIVGDLKVSFTLPRSEPATIQLLDVSGRTVESLRVTASGQASLSGNGLTSGVYWVKLTQGARTAMARTVYIK